MALASHILVFLITAVILVSPCQGAPAQTPDSPTTVQESPFQTAPVTIDGNILFPVRGLQAYPAEERATRIGTILEKVAQDDSVKIDAITAVESGLTTDISANG